MLQAGYMRFTSLLQPSASLDEMLRASDYTAGDSFICSDSEGSTTI